MFTIVLTELSEEYIQHQQQIDNKGREGHVRNKIEGVWVARGAYLGSDFEQTCKV
jgi:hypothetical protein